MNLEMILKSSSAVATCGDSARTTTVSQMWYSTSYMLSCLTTWRTTLGIYSPHKGRKKLTAISSEFYFLGVQDEVQDGV